MQVKLEQKSLLISTFKQLLSQKGSAICLFILAMAVALTFTQEIYLFYCNTYNLTPIYEEGNMVNSFQPPSAEHWFGTDYRGRDVLLRAIAGTATAVKVGLIASLIAAVIGVLLGAIAGYYGGIVDDVVVWIYSTFAAMPTLLFILSFSLLVSKGFLSGSLYDFFCGCAKLFNTEPAMFAVYLGIGLTGWVSLCRVVRAETMKLRKTAYAEAAVVNGFSSPYIIFKHIIPNLFHLVIIYFSMRFAYAIMTEVIVSYLGLGAQSSPSWGVMISDGQMRLWRGIYWEVGAATLFMFVLVLCVNLLSDYLRDILDPKLKR
ncbi:ABC transporter permease [Lentisphaerota bacterium WC36G]|nr:ABC transporter permease [Lentisphaerae bacterium WC36]